MRSTPLKKSPLSRKSVLGRGKGLDRGSKLRVRSKNKRAVTVAGLVARLSKWALASPCAHCGAKSGHSHHILTRGSQAGLKCCPSCVMPLCEDCHGYFHDCPATFQAWLENEKPGLRDHLKLLARTTWAKKPLDEVEAEIDRAVKRTWREHWESLEVGA